MKIIKFCLYFVTLITAGKCLSQSNEALIRRINEKAENMPNVVCEQTRHRDETFIEYTVRAWMDNDYEDYHYLYQDYKKKNRDKVKISVDAIYYSPDSLKLFSFIIIEQPIHLSSDEYIRKNTQFDPSYSGHVVVGVRDSAKLPWLLYNFSQYRVFDHSSPETIQLFLRNQFFVNFKYQKLDCFDEYGKWGLYPFKYNLDEPEFWTGPVFDKARYNGVGYYFQIYDFRSPEWIDAELDGVREIINALEIDYPKILLDQFK